MSSGAADLTTGVQSLASGAASADSGAQSLSTGAQSLATGAASLDSGAAQVAAGTGTLAGSVGPLTTGLDSAASGAGALASGTASLASGSDALATGADSAAQGSADAATGAGSLASGVDSLASGSETLSGKLADGAADVPSYTADQADALSAVAAAVTLLPALTGAWRHRGGGASLSTSGSFGLDTSRHAGAHLVRPGVRRVNMNRLASALEATENPLKALFVFNSNPAAVAPDSSRVRRGLARDDLFTAIVQPGRDVSSRYRTALVATADGQVYQGMIVYEAVDGLILQTGATATVRLAGDQIVGRRDAPGSIMPAGLLDKLPDREIADLYAYLKSLTASDDSRR